MITDTAMSSGLKKQGSSSKPKPVLNLDVEAPDDNADLEPSIDMDADDPPEDSMEAELESDLQPAHRAEALDVLAILELKFALLRERVYVEKMDALAWEETLIAEGISLLTYLVQVLTCHM